MKNAKVVKNQWKENVKNSVELSFVGIVTQSINVANAKVAESWTKNIKFAMKNQSANSTNVQKRKIVMDGKKIVKTLKLKRNVPAVSLAIFMIMVINGVKDLVKTLSHGVLSVVHQIGKINVKNVGNILN